MDRYIAVQEPTCTWAVFDTFDDVPAEFGGLVLVGLDREEAEGLAACANAQTAPRARRIFAHGRLRLSVGRAA